MSLKGNLVSASKARQIIANEFAAPGISPETALQAAIAEYLRNSLSLFSSAKSDGVPNTPIHVLALLSSVRRQLRILMPPTAAQQNSTEGEDEDIFREVLEWLSLLREVIDLGHGYYLPAPLRFVDIGDGNALLIAGLPSSDIVARYGFPIAPAGVARTVLTDELPIELRSDNRYWQPLNEWAARPVISLEKWTDQNIEAARKTMSPSSATDIVFEVYSPNKKSKDSHYYRWLPAESLAQTDKGVFLCRTRVKSGPRRYFLANLDGSRSPNVVSEATVSRDLRLQYGLDLKAKAPETAKLSSADKSTYVIELRSPVPKPEERILRALALQDNPLPRRLPIRLRFSSQWHPQVLDTLDRLGVHVREEKGPNGRK